MILAWVISLLLLCSSLIVYLERLTVLRVMEVKTIEHAQEQFIAAEKSVLQCEDNITNTSVLTENDCFIEPAGKNQWRISSKEKPSIQIHVHVNEKSGVVSRLNWRQAFE
ncbi:hypothetical protein [Polynucleobacter sp. MG-6-Vaara-E2]|uniref:hypothetical protein n=1 Tax=Polynucleobacter sp. MG-6-Vaara-E2 TaxID=2576932 RepID=UPI001BFD9350|nr:hypothetical protein [Polynucleobacter sp. MG-6-Vaara-E2]QWD96853.1 hypothetical protein ICV38_01390 [Polynucleobacter sp. MG-6-Vaara-E2]